MIQEELSGEIIDAEWMYFVMSSGQREHPVIAAKPPFCEPALSERSESNGRRL